LVVRPRRAYRARHEHDCCAGGAAPDVMSGKIDGDRLVFETIGARYRRA
jgi:hypothetical protein